MGRPRQSSQEASQPCAPEDSRAIVLKHVATPQGTSGPWVSLLSSAPSASHPRGVNASLALGSPVLFYHPFSGVPEGKRRGGSQRANSS